MSLYKAETRRLVKRRFVRYAAVAGLVLLAAVAVGVFFTNHKVTPETIAGAERQAEQAYQEQLGYAAQEKAACEAAKGTANAGNFPADCERFAAVSRDDVRAESFMPPSFAFRDSFGTMLSTLAAILALVAFVAGASFVGAEWSSGGMMNLLLWRPQRVKVLGTKLAALLVGLTSLTVVSTVLWTAALWVTGMLRGNTDHMTAGVWQSFGLTALRGLILVLAAGAVGFALASLGRHTAMALGVAIGVAVFFQFGLGTVLSLARVKFIEAYLIPVWAIAWMQKSMKLEDYTACNSVSYGGDCQPETFTLTWQLAGGVLTAVVLLVVGAAMWTMRNRDVT